MDNKAMSSLIDLQPHKNYFLPVKLLVVTNMAYMRRQERSVNQSTYRIRANQLG